MDAIWSLQLNIMGSFDTVYVYLCQNHADEYERDMPKWILHKRRVSSLHVCCNRCDTRGSVSK